MGGKGLGRRRGEERGSKPTTDQIPTLDVRSLRRTGVAITRPGQERIGDGSKTDLVDPPGVDPLQLRRLEAWFLCPGEGCGRRVAILYGPTLPLLCRLCRGLR